MRLIIMSVFLSLLLVSCGQDEPTPPKIVVTQNKNSSITSVIKEKLDNTKELQGVSIYPHIEEGKMLLSGIVHTQKQKFLAGSIARSVEGAGVVVNRLVLN